METDKLASTTGGVTGTIGFLGSSFPICHSICQAAIGFLAIFGIYIASEGPLMWLQDYAIYFWSIAFAVLIFGIYMYKKKCMSDKVIIFNAGVVVAGMPFVSGIFQNIFYTIGGIFVILSIGLFISDKLKKKKECCNGK